MKIINPADSTFNLNESCWFQSLLIHISLIINISTCLIHKGYIFILGCPWLSFSRHFEFEAALRQTQFGFLIRQLVLLVKAWHGRFHGDVVVFRCQANERRKRGFCHGTSNYHTVLIHNVCRGVFGSVKNLFWLLEWINSCLKVSIFLWLDHLHVSELDWGIVPSLRPRYIWSRSFSISTWIKLVGKSHVRTIDACQRRLQRLK